MHNRVKPLFQKYWASVGAVLSSFGSEITSSDSLRARLMRGGIGSAAVNAASTLTAFVVSVVLARSLGPKGFGVYSFVYVLVLVMAMPAQLGIPDLVVRETAKTREKRQWGLMFGLWRWSTAAIAIFSILIIFMTLVIVRYWLELDANRTSALILGLAMVFLLSLGKLRGAALQGLGHVVMGQLPENLLRPAVFLLLILSYAFIPSGDGLTATTAMGLHVIAAGTAFLIGAALLWRVSGAMNTEHDEYLYEVRYWVAAILPLSFAAGLQIVNQYANILILGVLATDEDVGIYRTVVQVATIAIFVLQAINLVVMPHFARLHTQGDYRKLQRLVTISARLTFFFALPVFFIFLFWGDLVLGLVFGNDYAEGHVALAILAGAQLINAWMGSVGRLLAMTGHEKDVLRGMIFPVLLNVVLNIVFIPIWGIEGAAVATAISIILWNISFWFSARRRIGIDSMAFRVFSSKGMYQS